MTACGRHTGDMPKAANYTINPEVAEAIAAACDELFTTDRIVDASAVINGLITGQGRFELIRAAMAANTRLLGRYLAGRGEPMVEIRELAARLMDRVWSSPEDEVLAEAQLLAHYYDGNLNRLDAETRHLLETADFSTDLVVMVLISTGLSAIVSREENLPHYGDALREVLLR